MLPALTGCTKRWVKRTVLDATGVGCPSCGATTPEACKCFADPFCAGYQITRWTPLTPDDCGHPSAEAGHETEGPEKVETPPADGATGVEDNAPKPPGETPPSTESAPAVPPGAGEPGVGPGGSLEDLFPESTLQRPGTDPGVSPLPPSSDDAAPFPGSAPPTRPTTPPSDLPDLFDQQPDPAPKPSQPALQPETIDAPSAGAATPRDPAPLPKDIEEPAPAPSQVNDGLPADQPSGAAERAKSDPAPAPPKRGPGGDLDLLFPEDSKGTGTKSGSGPQPSESKSNDDQEPAKLPDLFDTPSPKGSQSESADDKKEEPKKETIPDDLFPQHAPGESVPQENMVKIRRILQASAADEPEPAATKRLTGAVEPAKQADREPGPMLRIIPLKPKDEPPARVSFH